VISRELSQVRKRISIIVLTYNSAAYIGPCLESILAYTEELDYEVIVADNSSTDETVDIASSFERSGGPIRVIRFTRNEGFARGNNRAVKAASGSYLVLLNPDTMVTPRWLSRLRWHLRDDPAVGLVCPVTNFAGNEARIEANYRCAVEMELFSRLRSKVHFGQRTALPMAPLFCALLETDLFKEVGGLDESYGIGMFEDDDFSQKILRQQKSVVCAEDCFVHHFGQGSFGALQPPEYEALFRRNQETFERRWKTAWTPHVPRKGVGPVSSAVRYDPAVFSTEWARLRGFRQKSSASAGVRE
jgi:GT2 family glycosyltransferase